MYICLYICIYVYIYVYVFLYILSWPKSPLSFFLKGTFFIFTNNFIDLGILNMLAISCMV